MNAHADRGHRSLPHTADVIVEAWGPTLDDCLEEAVRGLVESFADPSGVAATRTVPVSVEETSPEDLLVELLEEVIYLLDVLGVVPVAAAVDEIEGGGVSGNFEVAPLGQVEVTGAVPKGVSLSGLEIGPVDDGWRARVLIDV